MDQAIAIPPISAAGAAERASGTAGVMAAPACTPTFAAAMRLHGHSGAKQALRWASAPRSDEESSAGIAPLAHAASGMSEFDALLRAHGGAKAARLIARAGLSTSGR